MGHLWNYDSIVDQEGWITSVLCRSRTGNHGETVCYCQGKVDC